MKKRLLAALLAVIMVCALLPAAALASDSDFVIDEDGVLTKYNGPGGDVVIPDSVTAVGDWAFAGCVGLTSVVIPEGVTYIGFMAFIDCTALEAVGLPDSLVNIGDAAFENCASLTSVTIPDASGGVYIGTSAFEGAGLTSVTIPAGNTVIGQAAFYGTPWLESLGEFPVVNGALLDYQGSGGHVTVPKGVTRINDGAFFDATDVTSVTIPEGVTYIGWDAFAGCTNLVRVELPESLTCIKDSAFRHSPSLTDMTIPVGVTEFCAAELDGTPWLENFGDFAVINGTLMFYQGKDQNVVISEGVTGIGQFAFSSGHQIKSLTIPESVTHIDWCAFLGCSELTDIYYGGSRSQWYSIEIDDSNDRLHKATLHFDALPFRAYPSTQEVEVDGRKVIFQCYALKDGSGNLTNYIKLRDLADILQGTAAQFGVGWDGQVSIAMGQSYVKNGLEQRTPFSGERPYQTITAQTLVNGQGVEMTAFQLFDDDGGGYTYYRLRDLGQTLGFNVGWGESGIFVETDKAYDPSN